MVYIAWAKMPAVPVADKPFANELRLSRSLDSGQTFLPSAPINDDGEPVLHSFDSIVLIEKALSTWHGSMPAGAKKIPAPT